jgi:hypothetical protein
MSGGSNSWRFYESYHRKTSDEAFLYFSQYMNIPQSEFEDWVQNSHDWASRFGWEWKKTKDLAAKFYPSDSLQYTMDLIKKIGRMKWDDPKWKERLTSEINMLYKNGTINLLPYFFVCADTNAFLERNNKLTGPGRGCLSGNALVLTPKGFIPISKIEVGEGVINYRGETATVDEIFRYDVNELGVRLIADCSTCPFDLTKDHLVYGVHANLNIKRQDRSPYWIRAQDVQVGDFLYIPLLSRELKSCGQYHWRRVLGKSNVLLNKVYDLSVPNGHSFMTSEYMVHNSAAGLLLCYLLGITHINPLKYELSKERFLTETRIKGGKLPDIDSDSGDRTLLFGGDIPQLSVQLSNGETKTVLMSQQVRTVNGVMSVEDAFKHQEEILDWIEN